MLKAYSYKLIPNQEQMETLSKYFGCVRFIYNWGLNKKIETHKESGKSIGYVPLAKELTLLKKQEGFEWLKECSNESLQQSLRNLETAFSKFFKKNAKYPKFKSKKCSRDSVKFIQSVHFDFINWTVKLPKIGKVDLCKNRTFNQATCKQGTTTVSRDNCGTYWCVVTVDDLQEIPSKAEISKDSSVGIDLGIKDYAILSDGRKFSNPKHLENTKNRLAHLQKVLARKEKGSKNYEKMRIKVAKCHRKIANKRNDYLHNLSSYLVNNYKTICLEDLNVKGMQKNHNLARAIQDASWGEFTRQLQYKSDWNGNNIIYIGRFEPSSKTCSVCGYKKDDLKLSDRSWVCPQCGTKHDRDVNAAINIKEMALKES